MKIIFFTILALILAIVSCSETKKADEFKELTGNSLHSLVIKATNGDTIANYSLSGLIDPELAESNLYNFIKVDSFYLDNLKYFLVLIEYPNPDYNRLAIYDSESNCYLIDKSLNGKISSEVIEVQNLKFIKTVERFNAKDVLGLVRISFYGKIDSSFNLVYRSFAELKTPKNLFHQTIYSFSPNLIKTRISGPKKFKLGKKEDEFLFNSSAKSFRSEISIFDTLVYREIANYDSEVQK